MIKLFSLLTFSHIICEEFGDMEIPNQKRRQVELISMKLKHLKICSEFHVKLPF